VRVSAGERLWSQLSDRGKEEGAEKGRKERGEGERERTHRNISSEQDLAHVDGVMTRKNEVLNDTLHRLEYEPSKEREGHNVKRSFQRLSGCS
jgi:hypothetical protein